MPICRLVRLLRNASLDIRYGSFLGGTIPTRYGTLGAKDVANTDYQALAYVLGPVATGDDVIVDVGCGKGRVINWCLTRNLGRRIIGVELDPDVAESTRRRLRRYPQVQILTGNVIDVLPLPATLYYLFNPFDDSVLRRFRDTLATSALEKVKIVYYNPVHVSVFEEDGRWNVSGMNVPAGYHRACVITWGRS